MQLPTMNVGRKSHGRFVFSFLSNRNTRVLPLFCNFFTEKNVAVHRKYMIYPASNHNRPYVLQYLFFLFIPAALVLSSSSSLSVYIETVETPGYRQPKTSFAQSQGVGLGVTCNSLVIKKSVAIWRVRQDATSSPLNFFP